MASLGGIELHQITSIQDDKSDCAGSGDAAYSNFPFTNSGKYFTDTAPGSNTAS